MPVRIKGTKTMTALNISLCEGEHGNILTLLKFIRSTNF